MIKIAHIATTDVSLRYLLLNQLQTIQQERPGDFEVLGISSPGKYLPQIAAEGVAVRPVPMSRRFTPIADLRALLRLVRILRQERVALVHTHTPKAGLLGQYAAVLARVPLRVHTIHGLYFPGHMRPERRWAFVLLERLTMWFSHMNLSQNPEDIPVAIQERISAPERIRLIGNGIDLSTFSPQRLSDTDRVALRGTLGLTREHKVVGIVARFVAEKGYIELLAAAREIRSRIPHARFLIIGGVEPEKRDALDPGIITEQGLSDIMQFLGHRDDVADLYGIMDVLALPSHREGFPRAPMEAAAMGVPSVVTDIRGCRQTVDHGVTGLIVRLRDATALAGALARLLEDDEFRHACGAAAREKAVREFDERKVFARILAAYDDLLAARGPLPARMAGAT